MIMDFVFSFSFQPVGFVTFDSRTGAEAAKNSLNVSVVSFIFYVGIFQSLVFKCAASVPHLPRG